MIRHYVTPSRGIKVRMKGIVDMPELYKFMKRWLEDKGFAKDESLEKKYVERIKGNTKQTEIIWECGKTISDYVKYKIRVTFLLMGISETELDQEGKKIKLMKGDFIIEISGYVEEGSESWESLGPLTRIYEKLIGKSRINNHKIDLYKKIYSFQEAIKEFVGLR